MTAWGGGSQASWSGVGEDGCVGRGSRECEQTHRGEDSLRVHVCEHVCARVCTQVRGGSMDYTNIVLSLTVACLNPVDSIRRALGIWAKPGIVSLSPRFPRPLPSRLGSRSVPGAEP